MVTNSRIICHSQRHTRAGIAIPLPHDVHIVTMETKQTSQTHTLFSGINKNGVVLPKVRFAERMCSEIRPKTSLRGMGGMEKMISSDDVIN